MAMPKMRNNSDILPAGLLFSAMPWRSKKRRLPVFRLDLS
jgi:hypothetical protein